MPAASAPSQPDYPARPVERQPGGAPDGIELLLGRIRLRLGVDTVAIHLIEADRLHLRHCSGTSGPATADENIFHAHAMVASRPLVVPDAALDPRFRSSPLVTHKAGVRFFAGIPLMLAGVHPIGLLSLVDSHPRPATIAARLREVATDALASLVQRREARTIARLQAENEAKARLIEQQADEIAHSKAMFERAAATAKIGLWECELPGDDLRWSDGVYEIFDLPRDEPLNRQQALGCYSEDSRRKMEALRARAIEEQTGFNMVAQIHTPMGNWRWIRLTATVESRNGKAVRIFGMKQDITDEKILADRTRYLAEFDVMTGLANRSRFQAILQGGADHAGESSRPDALLLIDLDGFKEINDTFGHALGDECLKEAALRLARCCPDAELVARIGGDEFAVVLPVGSDVDQLMALAAEIVKSLGQPLVHGDQIVEMGASVGIAVRRGEEASDLFKHADAALYDAKAAGRGTYRMFWPPVPGAPDSSQPRQALG